VEQMVTENKTDPTHRLALTIENQQPTTVAYSYMCMSQDF